MEQYNYEEDSSELTFKTTNKVNQSNISNISNQYSHIKSSSKNYKYSHPSDSIIFNSDSDECDELRSESNSNYSFESYASNVSDLASISKLHKDKKIEIDNIVNDEIWENINSISIYIDCPKLNKIDNLLENKKIDNTNNQTNINNITITNNNNQIDTVSNHSKKSNCTQTTNITNTSNILYELYNVEFNPNNKFWIKDIKELTRKSGIKFKLSDKKTILKVKDYSVIIRGKLENKSFLAKLIVINHPNAKVSEIMLKEAMEEIKLCLNLHSKSIVKVLGCFDVIDTKAIIYENCINDNLLFLVNFNGNKTFIHVNNKKSTSFWMNRLGMNVIRFFTNSIIEALEFFSHLNMVHFKILPENILINKYLKAKVFNFSALSYVKSKGKYSQINLPRSLKDEGEVIGTGTGLNADYEKRVNMNIISPECLIKLQSKQEENKENNKENYEKPTELKENANKKNNAKTIVNKEKNIEKNDIDNIDIDTIRIHTTKPFNIDTYGLGITLYFMLFKQYPFDKKKLNPNSNSEKIENLLKEEFTKLNNKLIKHNENSKENISIELINLLKGLLNFDESERFSLKDLKENKWLNTNEQYISKLDETYKEYNVKCIVELQKSDYLKYNKSYTHIVAPEQKRKFKQKPSIFSICKSHYDLFKYI